MEQEEAFSLLHSQQKNRELKLNEACLLLQYRSACKYL